MDKIMQRVQEHYNKAVELGYEVVCVCLQGSQNYKLDTPESDIDTKAIVVPHFKDIVKDKSGVSTTFIMDNNEHLDIKDIRIMFQTMQKCNVNFLEILFTPYKIINPKYKNIIQPLFDNAEKLANMNKVALINAIYGQVYNKSKNIEHIPEIDKDKWSKLGYNPKDLAHSLRNLDFLESVNKGLPFKEILTNLSKNELDRKNYFILKNGYLNKEKALQLEQEYLDKAFTLKEEMLQDTALDVDEEAIDIYNKVCYDCMELFCKEELLK